MLVSEQFAPATGDWAIRLEVNDDSASELVNLSEVDRNG